MAPSPRPELAHNTTLIADPCQLTHEHHAASWLYLCGEEFAAMDGGVSYTDVEGAVDAPAGRRRPPLEHPAEKDAFGAPGGRAGSSTARLFPVGRASGRAG